MADLIMFLHHPCYGTADAIWTRGAKALTDIGQLNSSNRGEESMLLFQEMRCNSMNKSLGKANDLDCVGLFMLTARADGACQMLNAR